MKVAVVVAKAIIISLAVTVGLPVPTDQAKAESTKPEVLAMAMEALEEVAITPTVKTVAFQAAVVAVVMLVMAMAGRVEMVK
jgi:hypothetical protein